MVENQLIFLSVSVISLSGTNEVVIFYGNAMDNLFIRSPNTLTTFRDTILGDIEIFDFNYDGLLDLAICSSFIPYMHEDGSLSVFLNTGDDQQFEWSFDLSSLFPCHFLAIVDPVEDQKEFKIIYFIYWISGDTPMCALVVLPDHHAMELGIVPYNIHGLTSSMTKGRFNYDQYEDLLLVFPDIDTLQILLSDGPGEFTQEVYFTAPHPTSAIRINFNNDQFDDLAVLCCNRTITIFLGTSSGFMDQNYLSFLLDERDSTQCAHSLTVADLNGDGRDDLIFIDAETHSVYVLLDKRCYE